MEYTRVEPRQVVIIRDLPDVHIRAGEVWTLYAVSGDMGYLRRDDEDTGRLALNQLYYRDADSVTREQAIEEAAEYATRGTERHVVQVKREVAKVTDRGKRPFEETEDEYINRRYRSEVKRYTFGVEEQAKKVKALSPRVGSRRRNLEEATLSFWRERLAKLERKDDARIEEGFLRDYQKMIKKAISGGSAVPDEVIAQRPEYKLAATARARYEKGRHTSFANRSIAVNEAMRAERGYKVKRQDGKAITDNQMAEIAAGVDEIEEVVGPMDDLFDETDITIAHTSGKMPFLSQAGGLYSGLERTVSVGVGTNRPVRALAHELLGHWLDFESGGKENIKVTVAGPSGRSRSVTAASEDSFNNGELGTLLSRARRTMTRTHEARQLFRKGALKRMDEDEKAAWEHVKVHLGSYWQRPREIWARLAEQYVATKRGKGGVATEAPEYYHSTPAYWSEEEFAELMPTLDLIMTKRVAVLRGSSKPRRKPVKMVTKTARRRRSPSRQRPRQSALAGVR